MDRLLSPWAALPWFELPTQTTVQLTMGPVQLCQANPQRVALLIGSTGGAPGSGISINPGISSGQGLPITSAQPIALYAYRDGPLVAQAWYWVSGGGSTMDVVEVVLRDWPAGPPDPSGADLIGAVNNLSRLIRELTAAISGS